MRGIGEYVVDTGGVLRGGGKQLCSNMYTGYIIHMVFHSGPSFAASSVRFKKGPKTYLSRCRSWWFSPKTDPLRIRV